MRCQLVRILVFAGFMAGVSIVSAAPQTPFEGQVEVNNVTVEVEVRDEHGAAVTGLLRRDFRLLEDDSAQELTNFVEVADGTRAAGGLEPGAADPDAGRPVERRLVVFFDLYLMTEQSKRSVLESLEPVLLTDLPDGLGVAIASFDGRLQVHSEPTADTATLARALAEVREIPATGRQRQVELASADFHAPIRQSGMPGTLRHRGRSHAYWSEVQHRVQAVTGALTATLRRFASTPDRKICLFVSPGQPAADPLMDDDIIGDLFEQPRLAREAGLLGPVAEIASRLEYTLFAIDPSGTQVFGGDASMPFAKAEAVSYQGRFWIQADRKSNLINAAELTGGSALFTPDAGVGMTSIVERTATYYSLAYQPAHAGGGQEHEVRVEVIGHPEYRLSYRRRYVDVPISEREAEWIRSSLIAADTSNPLGLELVVEEPRNRARLGGAVRTVDLELRIPFARLTMIPKGEIAWAQVQVAVLAIDPKGNQSELTTRLVPIELETSRLVDARRHGYYSYRFRLEIAKGLTSIRVAVNDTLTHELSTVVTETRG